MPPTARKPAAQRGSKTLTKADQDLLGDTGGGLTHQQRGAAKRAAALRGSGRRLESPEQEAERVRRERLVMDQRVRGKSFYRIEKEFGIPDADKVFRRAIQRPENAPMLRLEALRLEEARLDDLQEGIWDKALAGDSRAVEVALKVLERRAKLLGLDFSDGLAAKLVEIEQAKVEIMAGALTRALGVIELNAEQQRAVTAEFFVALREHAQANTVRGELA